MLKPGKRQLKDITDQELQVIVEMSHHYGCKDFWGNPVITDILNGQTTNMAMVFELILFAIVAIIFGQEERELQ